MLSFFVVWFSFALRGLIIKQGPTKEVRKRGKEREKKKEKNRTAQFRLSHQKIDQKERTARRG